MDRMSMEMSRDLMRRGANVVVVSLLPGLVHTESVVSVLNSGRAPSMLTDAVNALLGVSVEVPGLVVATMVGQPQHVLLKQSGRTLFLSDLARRFGVKDCNKKYPTDPRSVKTLLKLAGWRRVAFFVPSFVKVPCWVLSIVTSKF
ncbi:unnamed protein product [Echinostoma caproni]|uniref:Uncharacterized protein n=1 Tax=Echinostoma caproni TaxID=27848 RepID=A0A3P8GUJ4_9TREM|nr:unnamed protein product [Echinostoma caproni]